MTDESLNLLPAFTNRAKQVIALANHDACRRNHEYVGTEHILLGLVEEGEGIAACVLRNVEIDGRTVRVEVEKLVQNGPDMVTMGNLPRTPRARQVLRFACEEARNMSNDYVNTEHILLGLLREPDGVGATVLLKLGLTLERARQEVSKLTDE